MIRRSYHNIIIIISITTHVNIRGLGDAFVISNISRLFLLHHQCFDENYYKKKASDVALIYRFLKKSGDYYILNMMMRTYIYFQRNFLYQYRRDLIWTMN